MIIGFLCPSAPHPVGGVLSIYHLANALQRRGHEVHIGHLAVWDRKITSLDEIPWFDFDPGIVHHFDGDLIDPHLSFDVVFGTGAPAELGLPVLLVQGVDMLYPWLERRAFRAPGLKICVSSWLVDVGVRYGAPAEQFAVALCGLDPDQFVVETPFEDRRAQVAVLHHTHVAKGWDVALGALEEARRISGDFSVAVFGAEVPSEPLPSWATFHHRPDHRTLSSEIYNRSQVFLQASYYEGLGLTAIEAMSSGCALVTTDCGGSRDYAIDGETALVAEPGDTEGLARRILMLLEDDGLRMRIARAGRDHVQRFDWDLGAATIELHLEKYLADPARYQSPPAPGRPLENIEHLSGLEGIPTAPPVCP